MRTLTISGGTGAIVLLLLLLLLLPWRRNVHVATLWVLILLLLAALRLLLLVLLWAVALATSLLLLLLLLLLRHRIELDRQELALLGTRHLAVLHVLRREVALETNVGGKGDKLEALALDVGAQKVLLVKVLLLNWVAQNMEGHSLHTRFG